MLSLSASPLNNRTAHATDSCLTQHDARSPMRHAQRLSFALLLVMFGVQIASANEPVSRYEMRVHQAVIELTALEQWAKADSPNEHAARVAKTLNDVRDAVPAEETIEGEGGTVRVNNSWLRTELEAYEKMSPRDPHRAEVLAQITERLSALEDRLKELREQKTVAGERKEQEKARLEAIQRREEFQEKLPQKNFFERTWERFKEWLNSLFPSSNRLAPGQMSWASFIAMLFIFALAAGVLAYAISKLMPYLQRRMTKLNLERREARIVLGERLAPDQTAADLLAEAEALARQGELRAAIRKAYIALLCELGDRKVIALAQYKTNRDYLRAVREKRERPLLDEMQKLTNSFENHWYGFQQTTADDWTAFRSGYNKVISEK
ncbi:MAG: hypothetical protein QOC96_3446 [Acidobacteriota bacterium]|nr:hypothetical protein [Acidobacteriota bacterium]